MRLTEILIAIIIRSEPINPLEMVNTSTWHKGIKYQEGFQCFITINAFPKIETMT